MIYNFALVYMGRKAPTYYFGDWITYVAEIRSYAINRESRAAEPKLEA